MGSISKGTGDANNESCTENSTTSSGGAELLLLWIYDGQRNREALTTPNKIFIIPGRAFAVFKPSQTQKIVQIEISGDLELKSPIRHTEHERFWNGHGNISTGAIKRIKRLGQSLVLE